MLDVDTAEDLAALRDALAERTGGAAHTRGLLAPPRALVSTVAARALAGLPEIAAGDDLAALLAAAAGPTCATAT